MRVICLVPSLTETLIECGVDVVGRTRFCIHPVELVAGIIIVGGTKNVDWDKCKILNPDLVVFDKEENPKEMAESCPFEWHATHITSIDTISRELDTLAIKLKSKALQTHAADWGELVKQANVNKIDWLHVPGQIESIRNNINSYKHIEYVIWREPWMAVSRDTFIGSMLEKFGFSDYLRNHIKAYPELSAEKMDDPDTFYLFSSEPYPFVKHKELLLNSDINGAIVDGEVYSWFGIRSYRALRQQLSKQNI